MVSEPGVAAIRARALHRRFGDFIAVSALDLTVIQGEVFGLLGANGAGKTTAMRMLCGTLAPTRGEVEVAGVDMVRHAQRARGRIGYVTQRFTLYGDLTVMENLKLQAGLYGLRGPRARERLDWGMNRLALDAARDTRTARLPLGYQRRVSIAAALLHQPDVLFLDEPTSGLDPLARQQFWELVYQLAESGIGVLVTTHYMDEALFCDRLALMDAGRIILEGTPAELLARSFDTPIIELTSPDYVECARWLTRWEEVSEVIPHAGSLQVRLRSGTAVAAFIEKARREAARRSLEIDAMRAVGPTLEDVFIAALESARTAP